MIDDHRLAFIAGLRDLADFLETNPDIPAPRSITGHYFPQRATDAEICAEVDEIAACLGSTIDPEDRKNGHYSALIHFGPVEYKAVAIVTAARAQYEADTSYRGCVQPGPIPATDAAQAA